MSRVAEPAPRRLSGPRTRFAFATTWPAIAATLLAVATGLVVALTDGGPSVFMDEAFYRDQAASIASFGAYANSHYPPVYPALLALGYLTSDPFRAMLVVNAVAGALIVPAVWWLSGELGLRRRWLPTVLSALLPVHGAFVGYLLSENLALPIFVVCVALCVRGRRANALVFGVVLGLLHLTRYFFLPVIVVLFVVWVLRTRITGDGRGWLRSAFYATLGYLGVLAAWTTYGMLSGFGFSQLWGLSTVEAGVARSIEGWAPTLTWLTQYSAYVILAAPAAWALIILWLSRASWSLGMVRRWSAVAAFGVVTLCSVLGYVALATLHSRGVAYNYPVPSHMQGRYVMHLVPLLMVAGCVALERITTSPRRLGWTLTIGTGCAVGGLALGAWWVLFRGGIWAVPAWGAQLPFNAIDVFMVQNRWMLALVSGSALIVPIVARLSGRGASVVWSAIAAVVAMAGLTIALMPPINGTREHAIADVVDAELNENSTVTVWLSDQFAAPSGVLQSLDFWGVDTERVDVQAWNGTLDSTVAQACITTSPDSSELWISANGEGVDPLYRSQVEGAPMSIHRVQSGCMARVVDDYERALAAGS